MLTFTPTVLLWAGTNAMFMPIAFTTWPLWLVPVEPTGSRRAVSEVSENARHRKLGLREDHSSRRPSEYRQASVVK